MCVAAERAVNRLEKRENGVQSGVERVKATVSGKVEFSVCPQCPHADKIVDFGVLRTTGQILYLGMAQVPTEDNSRVS